LFPRRKRRSRFVNRGLNGYIDFHAPIELSLDALIACAKGKKHREPERGANAPAAYTGSTDVGDRWYRRWRAPKENTMKTQSPRFLIAITAAISIAVIGQAAAQAPFPGTSPPQRPAAGYPDYRFNAPTPEDAYRQGLITRWQLEQIAGPTPQAMQGPSPDGSRGGEVAR